MIVRRTFLLSGVSAACVASCAPNATLFPQPPLQRDTPEDATSSYLGAYRLPNGHTVGVNRFNDDAGVAVLLWADHQTGAVRRLFEERRDHFVTGPSFQTPSPVENAIRFERDSRGLIRQLVLCSPTGTETTGKRIEVREEDVSFQQADATLKGTLIVPDGRGPHPAIVLLHGSGPLTRYSFGPYPRFFSSLGLAVLIYDKRGAGNSTGRRLDGSTPAPDGPWESYFPDDLKADALAALRLLQGRPDIDSQRIGFWGASEGGMLTTQVAAGATDVAFAINSSGFVGPAWKVLAYQGPAQMKASGSTQSEVQEAEAFISLSLDVSRTGEQYERLMAWREEIQNRGKKDWLFYYSQSVRTLEKLQWTWKHKLSFDPAPNLQRVTCPVLGLFGERDPLTDAPAASRELKTALVSAGNQDVTTLVFPDAGHSLNDPTGSQMAPGVFDTLRTWMRQRLELP